MAQIAVNPLKMSNVLLRIVNGSTTVGDFEKHVSAVTITPSTGSVDWKGLHPDAVFSYPTATTWDLGLTYVQDWKTANSLSAYLFEHEGETVTVVMQPDNGLAISATNPAFRVVATIVPGAIGGNVDSMATGTVTLKVQGKPQRIATLS